METFRRGFFCADLSIRYPYRDPTLSVKVLAAVALATPMCIIVGVELLRLRKNLRLAVYLSNLWRSLLTFCSGFLATYLTSELAKNMVGRLRPHFYDACKPRFPDGSTCEDGTHAPTTYVEEYYCSNENLTPWVKYQMHISFPSSHSSLCFYGLVFMVFYLHARWQGPGWHRALRHTVQFVMLMIACYFALSRIADYWHHWSDVLAGSALGAAQATLSAIYVGRLLRVTKIHAPHLFGHHQHCSCCNHSHSHNQIQSNGQTNNNDCNEVNVQQKEHLMQSCDYEWKVQTPVLSA